MTSDESGIYGNPRISPWEHLRHSWRPVMRSQAFVTQPDKPKGPRKTGDADTGERGSRKHGLPVYQPRRVRDAEAIEEIRKMEPDVIVVVAFGQIIPKEILDMPKYGCINVHASLLPAYRGAAPIQWADHERR